MSKQLSGIIARITVNPDTKQILDIYFYEENLRFKCKRCAVYCCKLGGPNLTKGDIDKIESFGYNQSEFIELAKRHCKKFAFTENSIKSKKDGSCIFLKTNEKNNNSYKCSIYDARPVLCRLYPFDVEKTNANTLLLRIIPCCKGLNNPKGEIMNENFITVQLLESIYALLQELP